MKNKRSLLNLLAAVVLVFSQAGVGTNSWLFFYQPELPKQLRK